MSDLGCGILTAAVLREERMTSRASAVSRQRLLSRRMASSEFPQA
jgi:hypothetical protein